MDALIGKLLQGAFLPLNESVVQSTSWSHELLMRIAYRQTMRDEPQISFNRDELERCARGVWPEEANKGSWASELKQSIDHCIKAGMIIPIGLKYSFAHSTVYEFLAGEEIRRRLSGSNADCWQTISDYHYRPHPRQSLLFAISQLTDRGIFLRMLQVVDTPAKGRVAPRSPGGAEVHNLRRKIEMLRWAPFGLLKYPDVEPVVGRIKSRAIELMEAELKRDTQLPGWVAELLSELVRVDGHSRSSKMQEWILRQVGSWVDRKQVERVLKLVATIDELPYHPELLGRLVEVLMNNQPDGRILAQKALANYGRILLAQPTKDDADKFLALLVPLLSNFELHLAIGAANVLKELGALFSASYELSADSKQKLRELVRQAPEDKSKAPKDKSTGGWESPSALAETVLEAWFPAPKSSATP
jgi:hypothetical protein